jgi:hypothetical protein
VKGRSKPKAKRKLKAKARRPKAAKRGAKRPAKRAVKRTAKRAVKRTAKRAAKRPAKRPAKGAAKAAAPRAHTRGRIATTPGEMLRPYPPSVRRLAHELRKLIKRTLPTVDERAYDGWHGIGYHDRQSGYLAGIFPHPDCVKVYFELGSVLPDPHHVLTGNGAQVRHVSCWPDVPVPERAIRELLAAAVRYGAAR